VTILRGRVRTGRGDFGKWIGRLQSHYREKTGLSLYPGTLNVELEAPYRVPPDPKRLEAREYGGSVSVNIVPCRILDLPRSYSAPTATKPAKAPTPARLSR